jgi:hypothetical protein
VIVTAAICWYDEPPDLLRRCVRSCAVIADRVVAFDGRYARWPGDSAQSRPEQADAIRAAAAEVGLEAIVEVPIDRPWAGQVEKRSALIARASEGSDWVQVVDADHVLVGDRKTVRQALSRATADVYEIPFRTPYNPDRPLGDAPHEWHREMAGQTVPEALLYRSLPEMRYERFHWWLSALKDGRRVWLWGFGEGEHLPAVPFPDPAYRIDHMALYRDEDHFMADRAFCNDREMVVQRTGQEDDRPDLPRPIWDYARLARG